MISAALLLLSQSLFFSLHLAGNPGSFPQPLSDREEQECLARWAEGNLEARNRLVEHNLRLVAHIIKKYYTTADNQDDLISIGTIGLIKAVNTFRPDKKIRLATYASRCIENAILSLTPLTPNNRWYKKKCQYTEPQTRFIWGFLLLPATASITAFNSSSFCCTGQFSPFSCWFTAAAWTSDTRRANISFPFSASGWCTIRLIEAISRITIPPWRFMSTFLSHTRFLNLGFEIPL